MGPSLALHKNIVNCNQDKLIWFNNSIILKN